MLSEPGPSRRHRESVKGAADDLVRRGPTPLDDPEGALNTFVSRLVSAENVECNPNLGAIGYELEALVSIYPGSVTLSLATAASSDRRRVTKVLSDPTNRAGDAERDPWPDAVVDSASGLVPGERIRYEVTLPAWEGGSGDGDGDPPNMRVLVSLPPTYPSSAPPQLQLLGRYLGAFPIDSGLFGDVTRTYITASGAAFTPGDVCVFDGLVHVQSVVARWYASRVAEDAEGERVRTASRRDDKDGEGVGSSNSDDTDGDGDSDGDATAAAAAAAMAGLTVHTKPIPRISSAAAITDRKSTFVGYAATVVDEDEVGAVVAHIVADKRVARAAHPAIFAYRIAKHVGGPAGTVFHADYDDDGETQAGARLKHLLEILELENVLVVVTRWFGGIHLGPDRFKHINQAARDALDVAGLLEEAATTAAASSARRRKGK